VVVTVDVLFCTARLDIALDSFSRLDVIWSDSEPNAVLCPAPIASTALSKRWSSAAVIELYAPVNNIIYSWNEVKLLVTTSVTTITTKVVTENDDKMTILHQKR
jgi:hypothetical protein